jgi:NAD(P)-dependent dehydrogenase (short-subunit alcohol dehydrogenase family)
MEITEIYETIRPRYPEFRGKVALVTGSSLSIGKGIALRLAREGMHIIIHGKEEAEVARTVREFQSLGVNTLGVCTDFSKPGGVDQLFDTIQQHHSQLHVLVNNAADLRRAEFDDASVALLDYQLEVNVRAPYLCSMRTASMMRPAQSGVIVNISSVGGQRAHWRGLPYDMTKGAIESMTRAMALSLAHDGIRVNAIAPGAIRGPRTPPPDSEIVQAVSARIPLGRFGSDLEIGAAVAFIASEDAAYITGQVLCVDGGIMAQLSPPGQPI